MAEFRSKEEAWAGALNGSMFILLGAAFPAFFIWKLASAWQEQLNGLHTMTTVEAAQGIGVTAGSFYLLALGFRLLKRAAGALGKR